MKTSRHLNAEDQDDPLTWLSLATCVYVFQMGSHIMKNSAWDWGQYTKETKEISYTPKINSQEMFTVYLPQDECELMQWSILVETRPIIYGAKLIQAQNARSYILSVCDEIKPFNYSNSGEDTWIRLPIYID